MKLLCSLKLRSEVSLFRLTLSYMWFCTPDLLLATVAGTILCDELWLLFEFEPPDSPVNAECFHSLQIEL